MLRSWIKESPVEKRVQWKDEPFFFNVGLLGSCDAEGHAGPASYVRLLWERNAVQIEQKHRNEAAEVCPVVEDVMNEEDMDDKEEQSQESRAAKEGHRRMLATAVECVMRDEQGMESAKILVSEDRASRLVSARAVLNG